MLQPRFVLFDAVGTLIYPRPTVSQVYAHFGEQYGASLTAAQIHSRFASAFDQPERLVTNEAIERTRWQTIVANVFLELPDTTALFESLWQHFAQSSSWALYPDVAEVWQTLTERGYELGIASNFDARLLTVCQGLPPLDRCQHVFYSSELGYPKPSPQFFTTIELRLGAPATEICLVGDDPRRDYAAALAAGWHAWRIVRAEPTEAGALHNLRQLLRLLA